MATTAKTKKTTAIGGLAMGLEGVVPYKPKKGEEYMCDAQKEHFRTILNTMKRQLMEDVDTTVSSMRDDDKNLSDFTDRATKEETLSIMLRTRDREGKLLKKVEDSLDSLDQGEYGYCESCGVDIGIRRLEARPTAVLCIDCKTLDEIRERQQGS